MKKKWMLAIVICIAAILVSIYGLTEWKEYKTTEIIEDTETKLTRVEDQDIDRVEIHNENTIILVKKANKWQDEEIKDLEYNQNKINEMIQAIADMTSYQMIRNVQDLTVYGITENSPILTIYDEANESQTFRMGSKVSGQDATYIWSDADEALYLLGQDQLVSILWNRNELVAKEMNIPIANDIYKLSITSNDRTIKFLRSNQLGTPEYEKWLLEGAFKDTHEANTMLVDGYLKQLESFERDQLVTTNTEDLQAYGLDNPSLMMEINSKYVIKFGNTEGEYTYFKYSGDPYIYKMLTEKVKPFKELDAFELIRKQIYVPQIEAIQHIILQQGDELIDWTIDPSKAVVSEVIENETETVDRKVVLEEGRSQVGEIPLTKEQTESLLQSLGSISIYKPLINPEIEQKQERAAEVSITYYLKNGSRYGFELVPYDPSYYILRVQGNVEFSVDKKTVVAFFNEFNHVLKEQQKEISK